MSANTYKPETTLPPERIANPTPAAAPNVPLPTSKVERQHAGAVNSSNPAGGYVADEVFKR